MSGTLKKKQFFFLLRIEKHDIFVPKNGKHTHTHTQKSTDRHKDRQTLIQEGIWKMSSKVSLSHL